MANQIKTFGMSRMSIGSCCDFHTKVNACITTATPAALHVTEKATAYTAAIELLSFIVNRERAFVSTVTLAEADDTRDRGSGVIAQVVNAYLTSPVADKRAAAILLNAKMSPYRGIRKHEYTKQTAETRGMLAMLDAEAEAVATLGLTEEVEAVREAAYAIVQPTDEINSFIASVNGLVGTYSGIAGSSSKGGKAEGGDTPEPEPEPAE